jgi:hypothetical protein
LAYEAKTRIEPVGIAAFLDAVEPPGRQAEARRLVEIFREVTGYEPRIHTGGMVGFGRYAYRYASGHSGVGLAAGFAPRKAEISIYNLPDDPMLGAILARLGPHRTGRSCLYLRRLDRVDEAVLREVIALGLDRLRLRWPVTPD